MSCGLFIDDILIYTRSADEHTYHLRILLQVLNNQQVLVKLRKYHFLIGHMAFLGHIVYFKKFEADPTKIDTVNIFPRHLFP